MVWRGFRDEAHLWRLRLLLVQATGERRGALPMARMKTRMKVTEYAHTRVCSRALHTPIQLVPTPPLTPPPPPPSSSSELDPISGAAAGCSRCQGLPDIARQVIQCILIPRFLSRMASRDVAGVIRRALSPDT